MSEPTKEDIKTWRKGNMNRQLGMAEIRAKEREEVRSRGYTHCTIDSGEYGEFLAKAGYDEISNSWGPTEVLFKDKWISIDEFDDMDGYNAYGCSDYRTEK